MANDQPASHAYSWAILRAERVGRAATPLWLRRTRGKQRAWRASRAKAASPLRSAAALHIGVGQRLNKQVPLRVRMQNQCRAAMSSRLHSKHSRQTLSKPARNPLESGCRSAPPRLHPGSEAAGPPLASRRKRAGGRVDSGMGAAGKRGCGPLRPQGACYKARRAPRKTR